MATSTVEDYVKAIYLLQQDAPTGEATVVRLAATLGVTKGSVTAMVRKLREAELAIAERYGGITLTPRGEKLALDMLRRHRLIEVFLVEVLGLDWSEVHEEAERLEHAMSGKVLDRLDAFLKHPTTDPHGDPIPDGQGRLADSGGQRLCELNEGDRATIVRVLDQDPGFLASLAAHGVRPGSTVLVRSLPKGAGSIVVEPEGGGSPLALSLEAAGRVLADPIPAPEPGGDRYR